MNATKTATPAEVRGIFQVLRYELSRWGPFFDDFERKLPKLQRDWADRRWGGGVRHSATTIKARAQRRGYYKRAKTRGVGPDFPPAVWTGKYVEATAIIRSRTQTRANTDPGRTYVNGFEIANFLEFWVRRQGGSIYDVRTLDRAAEKAVERFVNRIVGGVGSRA